MSQWLHNYRGSIIVDIDTCTACGLCYEEVPEVFTNREDGLPIVYIKPFKEDTLQRLQKVAQDCPSGSIILE